MRNVEYPEPICYLVFKNARIYTLMLNYIPITSLNRRMFEFSSLRDTFNGSVDLNCSINQVLYLDAYHPDLGPESINPDLVVVVVEGAVSK